jgi:hypothetical protein
MGPVTANVAKRRYSAFGGVVRWGRVAGLSRRATKRAAAVLFHFDKEERESLGFKAARGIASQAAENRMFMPYSGHLRLLKRWTAFNLMARPQLNKV